MLLLAMKHKHLSMTQRLSEKILNDIPWSLHVPKKQEWAIRKWKPCFLSSSKLNVWSLKNSTTGVNSQRYLLSRSSRQTEKGSSAVERKLSLPGSFDAHIHTALCVREFLVKHSIATLSQPPYSPDLSSVDLICSRKSRPL